MTAQTFIERVSGIAAEIPEKMREPLYKLLYAAANHEKEVAKHQAEEEARKKATEEPVPDLYSMNETMKKLGKCSYYTLVAPGGKYCKGYEEILEALKSRHYYSSGYEYDFFMYGVMCGIAEQREESRNKK